MPKSLAAAAVFAVLALPVHAHTEVYLVSPEKFTDVGRDRLRTSSKEDLASLRDHLLRKGDSVLPHGDHLQVWITDVDMAGDFEPWKTPHQDIRIVRDVYPPKVTLRFRWTGADGTVKGEGDRVLTDHAFMQDATARTTNSAMRFEEALLDRWLLRELKAP
jgi:DUF3016 family protein